MISSIGLILALPLMLSSTMSSIYSYTVADDSWLTISGSSTITSFECISRSDISKGNLNVSIDNSRGVINFSNALLNINVNSFDCNNSLLNKDLYKALGAEKYPQITIELLEAKSLQINENSNNGNINASVSVTINGKCKIISVPVEWKREGYQEYRFIGSKSLNMSDFDITPPSPAFGLIKVNNQITIYFNLLIEANTNLPQNTLTNNAS